MRVIDPVKSRIRETKLDLCDNFSDPIRLLVYSVISKISEGLHQIYSGESWLSLLISDKSYQDLLK